MAIDIKKIKPEVAKVAHKHNLALVILYGSQAAGKARDGSDIDIAVLGRKLISFKEEINLINEFIDVFKTDEVDVKSLHNVGPLFRYQVMRNSVLLFGDHYDYDSFKAYAFRDYYDSQNLFELKEILIKKRMQKLSSR